MMKDKLALLPGNGPTHHRVFIRLVAWGCKDEAIAYSNCVMQRTCSMVCFVDTNTQQYK